MIKKPSKPGKKGSVPEKEVGPRTVRRGRQLRNHTADKSVTRPLRASLKPSIGEVLGLEFGNQLPGRYNRRKQCRVLGGSEQGQRTTPRVAHQDKLIFLEAL